jgi:hypothetical protein
MEGATQPLADLLERLTGGPARHRNRQQGERYSQRLAAGGLHQPAGLPDRGVHARHRPDPFAHRRLTEHDRRLVAARAILGEWLGGSGGGWQDSGGVWPGIKLIHGVSPPEGDPEFGISRGRLLPATQIFTEADEFPPKTREKLLQQSLVLVHGGMAQDVGPILEMVTEKYLLRSETEWLGRRRRSDPRRDHRPSAARATSALGGCCSATSTAPSRPSFRGPAISTPTR